MSDTSTPFVWQEEEPGCFFAEKGRPADSTPIFFDIEAPGAGDNETDRWTWGMFWDSGEDDEMAIECCVMGDVPTREAAESVCAAMLPLALVQGDTLEDVKAAAWKAMAGNDGVVWGEDGQ